MIIDLLLLICSFIHNFFIVIYVIKPDYYGFFSIQNVKSFYLLLIDLLFGVLRHIDSILAMHLTAVVLSSYYVVVFQLAYILFR